MINLAGHPQADQIIRSELERCGIEVVEHDSSLPGEVRTSLTGRLGPFTFERAWYYWIVKGDVPLAVAEEMYANRVGRQDIRVSGHCGCPAPTECAGRKTATGRRVFSMSTKEEAQGYLKSESALMRESAAHVLTDFDYSDDLEAFARFIDLYHIDSELGLYIFAEAIKRHGLAG